MERVKDFEKLTNKFGKFLTTEASDYSKYQDDAENRVTISIDNAGALVDELELLDEETLHKLAELLENVKHINFSWEGDKAQDDPNWGIER